MKLILVAWKYLKRRRFLTGLVLFLIIMASLFEGASFGMLIPLIQSMMNKTGNALQGIPFIKHLGISPLSGDQTQLISFTFIVLFILLLIKNIFVYFSNLLIQKARHGTVRELSVELMDKLLEYDLKYFDNIKTGHIINGLNVEMQRIGAFMQAVLQFIAFLGKVSAYVVLLFLISWKASIVIFVLIASVLMPIELIVKRMKKIGARISEALAGYNYKLTEILNGIRLIKGAGSEDLEKKDFKKKADLLFSARYKRHKYNALIIPLSEVFIFGLVVLAFLIILNVIKIDMANTFPFIATYLLVLTRTLTQLNTLNSRRSEAISKLAAFEVFEKMYDERDKKTIKSGNKKVNKFSGSIQFKNVNFSYVNSKRVLKDINLNIPKGKITALVGSSGAGKSTVVNLIPRFYDIDSGEILVDGVNVKDLAMKQWRKKIGFVSQDVFIFNTNVRNNISYGHHNISEEEMIGATKAANAHDFIMNLQDGYDTVLGERGVKLSGGQKQRISIARAIMRNPEILILDEATSSLDTETERLITQAIANLTKDRTVIAIAHRLSTILHADNIVVLHESRVVEEGPHAHLLEKNGLYKKLYEKQFYIRS